MEKNLSEVRQNNSATSTLARPSKTGSKFKAFCPAQSSKAFFRTQPSGPTPLGTQTRNSAPRSHPDLAGSCSQHHLDASIPSTLTTASTNMKRPASPSETQPPPSKRPRSGFESAEKENKFWSVLDNEQGQSRVRAAAEHTNTGLLSLKALLLTNHRENHQDIQDIDMYELRVNVDIIESIKLRLKMDIDAINRFLTSSELLEPDNSQAVQTPSQYPVPVDLSPTSTAIASPSRPYEDMLLISSPTLYDELTGGTANRSLADLGEQNTHEQNSDPFDEDAEMWGTFEEVTTGLGDEDPLAEAVEKPASPEDRPYAAEVDKNLKDVFRLESFRPDQFEAICATMDGRDVFVLMPTGGGKSLCYQLPAICVQGQTRGVTIVVSPLLALMHDQVSALRALGVDAVSLDSETPVEEAKEIWKRISSGVPPMLLYVTPERLIRNPSFRDIISKLYRAKQLARFVIDEAHCISTWIEFRATYGDLHELRDNFPGVPIMALTATATPETVDNIVESLKLENPAIFRQSFNRTNLNYRVVTKVNVDEMVGFIKKYHPNKSGIIFTMTKSACKKLSSQLAKKGLSARHFHAKISSKDKEDVLSKWHSGECRIVVATTAFGMGINKADVRFVIHFGLPKTLDGYYQETGRAGRDGLAADCVLYYSDQDLKKMVKITSDDTSQKQALRVVEEYCKNDSVCRRTQLLQHLGETFDEKDCHSLCDNCTNDSEALDFTKEAKSVVELVQFFENQHMRVTLLHCLAVYRGNDTKEIRENGRNKNPAYGSGSSVAKEVARLIFTKLLGLKILREEASQFSNYTAYYLKLGPDAANFLEGNVRIVLQVNSRKSKPTAKTRFKGPLRNDAIPSSFFDSLKTRHSREEDESDEDEVRLNGGPKDSQMTDAVAPGSAQSPHSVEEIEVDSDSDELLLKGPHKSERKNSVDLDRLYKKLLAHRQQIIIDSHHSLSKNFILDDETLQHLRDETPQDSIRFRQIMLRAAVQRFGTLEEAKKDVDVRFTAYGGGFLRIFQADI